MSGNLQLKNIIINNELIQYEVVIYGILNDVIKKFNDYTLGNIDLKDYNHTRNKSAILNSWKYINNLSSGSINHGGPGEGYIYPYIINGNRTDINSNLFVSDVYPSPYVKMVWDRMFKFAGITYTSNFINSEYFKKLFLPYTGDRIQKDAQQIEDDKVIVGVSTDITANGSNYGFIVPEQDRGSDWWYNSYNNYELPFGVESGTVTDNGEDLTFTDNNNQWTNDSIYTCQNAGFYNINVDGKLIAAYRRTDGNDIEFNSGNLEYSYQLKLFKNNGTVQILDSSADQNDPNDDGTQIFQPSAGSHTSPWFDIDNPLTFNPNADNVWLEVGDKIQLLIGFHYLNVSWVGIHDNKHKVSLNLKESLDGVFSKITILPSSNDSMGNDSMNMNQILDSKYKMKDFFKDIINMFNLVVQDNPNKPGDLIIEPRDDFYKSRQRVLDWTDILDRDSDIKITPMSEVDAKTFLFTYSKDSDYYNEEYTSETDRIYGDLSIDIDNDFSDKTKKSKIGFSPTPTADKWTDGRIAPYFTTKTDDGFKAKKVKKRILFYGGKLPSNYYFLKDNEGDIGDIQYEYPYCGMWDNPIEPKWDLSFGRPNKIYHSFNKIPNSNLYEQFHKATINNIIDVNAKMFEGFFHLTPKDIAEFDFRDMILIDGSYWRVNKIEGFNPVGSDTLTKVILYKLVDVNILSPFQVEAPQSNVSCPNDIFVNLSAKGNYYASKSGQEITEDCCKQLGGIYQNGICKLMSKKTSASLSNESASRTAIMPINSGQRVMPTSNVEPISEKKDGNTINTLGVKVIGSGNYVPKDSKVKLIVGNNNSVAANVKDSVIIGNDITATESGAIYLGDIKINKEGNLINNKITIIDGGCDTVVGPFDKTNYIDIIDGSKDAVRNYGGDSKSRPIIDGNDSINN